MDLNEFSVKLQRALEKKSGEAYKFVLRDVQKNNGICKKALTIVATERNISPTLYLETFWEAYEAGMPLAKIVEKVEDIYQREMPQKDVDLSFFMDYNRISDKICYRLIQRAANEELLEQIPYIPYLDLAICFYIAYCDDEIGDGTILIHNSYLKSWDKTPKDLYDAAMSNTPVFQPAICMPIQQLMNELSGAADGMCHWEEEEVCPMKVLSNKDHTFGAASMLYPGVLTAQAEEMGGSMYVIPSSVHEIILLKDGPYLEATMIKEMIKEVNSTQLQREDKLSDSLYYYDIHTGLVERV